MTDFNAILTVNQSDPDGTYADSVLDGDLGQHFHGAIGYDSRGRTQIIITLTAEDLTQAITTARALFADQPNPIRLDVMTTAEYDCADEPIPALVTVTQAAEILHTSKQAVMGRINRRTLPAARVGTRWVLPASALR